MTFAHFPDLVFVSLENWDEVWRRNQFLCAGLSQRFPNSKILFIGLPRDYSNALRRRDFSDVRAETTPFLSDYPNICVSRPPKIAPSTLNSGRRWNERLFARHVRTHMAKLQIKRPLLWINAHDAAHLAGQLDERALVYDITDDWALASISAREKLLIEQQDRQLCARADLTIVCSQALFDSRQALCRQLLLLPNGVDVAHYQSACDTSASTCRYEATAQAPVFGYTGTLHDDRVDADLVIALARAFPSGRVQLIGPDNLSEATRTCLKNQPNIEMRGALPYAEIARAMQPFDVCIVPHRETAFTQSLNPIKLWEYLACGKPIVSTRVAGFANYPHLVELATGQDEWIAACRRALDEGSSKQSARQEIATDNSWQARLNALLEELGHLQVLADAATARSA